VIYPAYDPSYSAVPNDSNTALYELPDNSADYVGTPPEPLTGDGVIYPAYDPSYSAVPNDSNTALYELPDNSGDYIGSDGSLLGDGVIYPAQEKALPISMLAESASHDGAYYCADTSGFPADAQCGTEVVDPVLKPIEYPASAELAAPIVAAAPAKAGSLAKPARPTPGHFVLMAPAALFGAAEATLSKLSNPEETRDWTTLFAEKTTAAASAVTPVGGYILKSALKA